MAKCNALHAIINSNCLLSTLKAPFNIECHFLSIIIHIYIHNTFCYSIIEPHHTLIFYLFFSFFLTFLLTTLYKKQKQKRFLFPISPHQWLHFLQPFSFPLCLLPPPLLSNSPLHFIIYHNLTLILPILIVHTYSYTSPNISLPSLPLYLPLSKS